MFAALLVFGFVVTVATITCTQDDDWGGTTFTMYRFQTKEDCDKEVNCERKVSMGRGCKLKSVDKYIKTSCFAKDVIEVESSCSDKDCDLCPTSQRYGQCQLTDGDYWYVKSSSCTIGDRGSDLLLVGSLLLGIGVLYFCCCYILIPVGAIILCCACNLGCRDIE